MHILIPNPRFISKSTYKSPFQPSPHVNPKLTSTHSHITSHYTIQNQKPYSATCFFIIYIYTCIYQDHIYIFLKALHQLHNSTTPSLITSSFFYSYLFIYFYNITHKENLCTSQPFFSMTISNFLSITRLHPFYKLISHLIDHYFTLLPIHINLLLFQRSTPNKTSYLQFQPLA